MNSEFWYEVRRIFIEASEKPTEQRGVYLDNACAENPELRNRVQTLLATIDQAGEFLGDPTLAAFPNPEILTRSAERETALHEIIEEPDELEGTMIGPYKVLQRIGQGGFGSVYLAEQREGMFRKVALKIIKWGMDTREFIARFEAERQALAMMAHDNIARVFDAGATKSGRPYFVMELVKGEPITNYCDRENLTISERLQLFGQVCAAVQHAHTKGIIHRDLKPSNVLVTIQDEKPIVKVIDFGIAKATNIRLTDKTYFTRHDQFIGTPAYMSPEQASGDPDIDTRSDVYSMGVLLYELLTGTTPIDSRQQRFNVRDQFLKAIRDETPPKPSTRLSQSADTLKDIAAHRRTHPRRLSTMIRGDLDIIVMKAIEKERGRRYESVSYLAEDLRHYLAGEPINATPSSAVYRIRKFVKRNRLGVTLAASFLVVVGLASSISAQSYLRAQEQTKAAQAIFSFMENTFDSADDFGKGKSSQLVVDAMEVGAENLLTGELEEQPAIRAKLLEKCAHILGRNGKNEAALKPALKALAIQQERHHGDHEDVAHSMYVLGTIQHGLRSIPEAESLFTTALAMAKRMFSGDHPDIAEYLSDLAIVREDQKRHAEAEQMLDDALKIYRRIHAAAHPDLAAAIKNLASCMQSQLQYAEAEPLFREALLMRKQLHPSDHPFIAISLMNLAVDQHLQKNYDEAPSLIAEAHDMCIRHTEWHPDVRLSVFKAHFNVFKGARRWEEFAIVASQELFNRRAALSRARLELADDLDTLGGRLVEFKRPIACQSAVPMLRESMAIREEELPKDHNQGWTKYRSQSVLGEAIYGSIGAVERGKGASERFIFWLPDELARAHLDEAERLLLQVWEQFKQLPNQTDKFRQDLRNKTLKRVARFYEVKYMAWPDTTNEAHCNRWREILATDSYTKTELDH